MTHVANSSIMGDRRDRARVTDITGRVTDTEFGDAVQYQTRMGCIATLVEKMAKYPASRDPQYNTSTNYTGIFNSWLMATGFENNMYTYINHAKRGSTEAYFEITRQLRWSTCEGPVVVSVKKGAPSRKEADNQACYHVFAAVIAKMPKVQTGDAASQISDTQEYNQDQEYWTRLENRWKLACTNARRKMWGLFPLSLPRVQIDDETEQGDPTQSSDKQENTIITMDQAQTVTAHSGALDDADAIASSETTSEFNALTARWMPLKTARINTGDAIGTALATYYLPEELYKSGCAPNLAPFEAYIYGRLTMEVRIVVNANKFCCGKIVASVKYDSYQADAVCNGYQSALARNHVILDLATNNEGVLQIPFRYHRPYLRLVKNDKASLGVRPSKYCSVYIQVLSPLQTGPDGASEVELRAYYRLKAADFTGMSYRVSVQMLGVEDFISPTTSRALKEVLVGAERAFDQLGKSRNQDKPTVVKATLVVPQPRLNFAGGKGTASVVPLRMNPHTLTNYSQIRCPDDEPKSFYDLARIWGVIKTFKWAATHEEGSELLVMTIDPTLRSYTADYVGEMTPLEYAVSNYCFWSGTIELRFDFVSNMFHTGTVQITAEFGRKTSSTSECESSSTYTKNFHLGEQKSVAFRVPYIYDTIMRRTTANVYNPYDGQPTSDEKKSAALTIAPESHTVVKVKVMNQLRPAQSAPQTIDVLVFMRAGKNFCMHGFKANSGRPTKAINMMDNFPKDGYKISDDPGRRRRDVQPGGSKLPEVYDRHMTIPRSDRNEWGEYRSDRLPFPVVQMDNGEKEDQDPTANFAEGLCALNALTLDCQMGFKDILRRPTLLIWRYTIRPGKNSGFFIPLAPPSRDMAVLPQVDGSFKQNGIFATTLSSTSAMAVMDMFRCWRGSQRYTIVSEGSKPMYVSLIPHSGVRIIGHHQVSADTMDYPICGANFTTEMLVPSVNPTLTVEAPYETENTWTLTFDEDALRNYAWRDKGDYNAGHICIKPVEDTVVTVWWSAGDDFEISNFYGIQSTTNNGWAYRYNDTHARVQMESVEDLGFRLKETVTQVTGFLNPGTIGRAAVACVPVVGTPLVVSNTLSDLTKRADRVQERVDQSLTKVDHLVETAGVSLNEITQALRQAVDGVSATLGNMLSGASLMYDFLLDILMAWMEKSWRIVGVAFVRCATKIFASRTNFEDVLVWGYRLGDYIRTLVIEDTPQVQVDVEETRQSTYAGILCGLVGTLLGVSFDTQRRRSYPAEVIQRLTTTSGVAYFVQVLRFVQQTFVVLKDLIMEGLGYVSPEAHALRMLSEKSEKLQHFITEAQIVTSESNGAVLNVPRYRNRVWRTVLQAYQIQRLIVQVPTNAVSSQLSRLCAEVIKYGNDKFMDLSASPVRYEPFVICIEGESRIGKSHVSETIVSELLAEIGFQNPSTENIYYRVAGEKFWSGYRDQPVIVYDEWLNTTSAERNIDQVVEFMKLKSTSLFIPEMAHLEEKKIRGNPLIIVMLCNKAFPNVSDYAKTPEAVFGRRDIVLRCERTSEYAGVDLHNAAPEVHAQVQGPHKPHLQFRRYNSAVDRQSLTTGARSYTETMKFLKNQFSRYHIREKEMVRTRMERLPCFAETMDHHVNLEDPFTLFYGLNERVVGDPTLAQNGWTPFEQMEVLVARTEELIEHAALPETEFPDEITWDSLATLPQTQYWLGVAGFVFGGTCLKPLVSAGVRTISRWLTEWEAPAGRMATCVVCQEEVRCAYSCAATADGETPHTLCISCYRGCIDFGNARCPMCRHPSLVPWILPGEVQQMVLWHRAAVKLGRGVKWLLEQLIKYYEEREEHVFQTMYMDFYFNVMTTVTTGRVDFAMGNNFAMGVSSLIKLGPIVWNLLPSFQSDDWDESDPVPQASTSRGEGPLGQLEWKFDEDYVSDVCTPINNGPICLHAHLVGKARSTTWTKDGWIIHDPVTRRRIRIPERMCLECSLTPEDYRTFLEHWATMNKISLRNAYIDYINEPSEAAREKIPPMYRPEWMQPAKLVSLTTWWDYLADKYAEYRNFILYTTGIATVVGVMLGVYRLASAFSTPEGVITQYSGTAVSPELSPRHRRTEVRRGVSERRYFQSETATPSVFEVCERYVVRNMMHFEVPRGDKVINMYGIGLFNNICMIPKHYTQEIRRVLNSGGNVFAYPQMDPQLRAQLVGGASMFIEDPHTDVAYIKLPPKWPLFKDIRRFCSNAADLERSMPAKGVLVAGPRTGADYIREIDVDIQGISEKQVILDQNNESFEVRDILVYNYSQPGACGSILLRENSTKPIISMHIAGVGTMFDGEGYGVLITHELLACLATERQPVVQLEDVEYQTLEEAKFVLSDDVHLRYLGSVSPEQVPYIPTKSKLVKSAIWGEETLKVPIEPAILSKQDPRYLHETTPLYEGIKKHGKITEDFTPAEIKRAQEQLWDGWISQLVPTVAQPRRLTYEQAIVGLDAEFYKGMDLSTSAGYPYMLAKDRTKTSKGDFITVKRDAQQQAIGVEALDPALETRLFQNEQKRRAGVIPHTLFVDTLKDEKRASEKVRTLGGTRVFCSAPVDNVIAVRQNFMHFIGAYMSQRHKMQHAVGINPTSTEWTRLTNALLRQNSRVSTIDYSNFGPGYNSAVALAAYELIIRWTQTHVADVDSLELWTLVWECVQSLHICNNTVYQQFAGSPSGSVFTTIINTLVNQMYLLLAWNALVGPQLTPVGKFALREWQKSVALYTYGDDAIFSVSDEYHELFNAETITVYFAKYRIVATDADKTGVTQPSVSLKDATFLKRGFRAHPCRSGEWLSPLKEASIKGITQWVWKSSNIVEATLVNCNAALLQAHGHGPDEFVRMKNNINRALIKRKIAPVSLQWGEIDDIYYTVGLEFVTDQLINDF